MLQKQAPGISIIGRGNIEIKGKGKMKTYWVDRAPGSIESKNRLRVPECAVEPVEKELSRTAFDTKTKANFHDSDGLMNSVATDFSV